MDSSIQVQLQHGIGRRGRTRLFRKIGASVVAIGVTVALGACSGPEGGPDDVSESVSISIADQPDISDAPGRAAWEAQAAAFTSANPNIKFKGESPTSTQEALLAKLAGQTIETAYIVALTEPQKLIAQKQSADITDIVKAWEFYDQIDPNVLAGYQDAEGRIYGFPQYTYSLAVVYNKALFSEAGLDPERGPENWDEFRDYAKRIADLGRGIAGYQQAGNGWHLTAWAASAGAVPETLASDGKWEATANDPEFVEALGFLHDMRWEDNSLGSTPIMEYQDAIAALASGQAGMIIATAGTPEQAANQFGGKLEDYGISTFPQNGGNATLTGGGGYLFSPHQSAEQHQAAFDWIVYSQLNPEGFDLWGQTLADNGGTAYTLPNATTILKADSALRAELEAVNDSYSANPLATLQPFLQANAKLKIIAEPTVEGQQVYSLLDPVVQAVLTTRESDPEALLDEANSQIQSRLLDPVNAQ